MAPLGIEFLIDCGNSRAKVARLGPDGPEGTVALAPEEVAPWWAEHGGGPALISPTGTSAAAVRAACPDIRVADVDLSVPDLGQYPGCGLDRVLAGLAAVAGYGPCLVVDAGTATTLNAWDRVDGRPRFLGGLICPGLAACAGGLAAQAPALPAVHPPEGAAEALQRDTAGAIGAALAIGHPAMVAACLTRLRRETGLTTLVVTGGGRVPVLGREDLAVEEPDLVLHGLHLLLTEET